MKQKFLLILLLSSLLINFLIATNVNSSLQKLQLKSLKDVFAHKKSVSDLKKEVRASLDDLEDDIEEGNEILCSKIDMLSSQIEACCPCDFVITNDMLPFLITEPGVYCVAEDLISPELRNGFSPVITVASSDVLIDLQGHTIWGGSVGILIGTEGPLSKIKVRNGNISDFEYVGIAAGFVQDIELENLSLITAPIATKKVADTPIKMAPMGPEEFSAIFLFNVFCGKVKNCIMSTLGQACLLLVGSSNLLVEDCIAKGFYSIQPFEEGPCSYHTFINCSSSFSNTHGWMINNPYVTLHNCSAFEAVNNGFYIQQDSVTLESCIAENNSDHGIYVDVHTDESDSKNLVLRKCIANENGQNGIDVSTIYSGECIGCSAFSNGAIGINSNNEFLVYNSRACDNSTSDYSGVSPVVDSYSVSSTTGFWSNIRCSDQG